MAAQTHPFRASPDARSLDSFVTELATNWASRVQSATDAHALFGAFNRVYFEALSTAARQWNLQNDKLRILPAEVREMCMFALPVYDKLRLSEVCSGWKDMCSKSPDIWSTITVDKQPVRLPAVLGRSGRQPLDVTIPVSNNAQLISAAIGLRSAADRLRFLRIDFEYAPARHESETAFLYALPVLDELQLHYRPSRASDWADTCGFDVPSNLFGGNAPKLRCVVLSGVGLPATCGAFARVSSASLKGPCNGIERVLTLFPNIRRLDILDVPFSRSFPPIRHHRKLAEVSIRHNTTPVQTLAVLGFLDLPRISVSQYQKLSLVTEVAGRVDMAHCPESSLVIGLSGSAKLKVRTGRGGIIEAASSGYVMDKTSSALGAGQAFAGLRHLVIPLRLRLLAKNNLGQSLPECPLIRGSIELLALRSLTMRRGGSETDYPHSLIDPAIMRGVLKAPSLARIVVDREREEYGPVEVHAAHLAAFIANAIVCDDPRVLELFIDTASGLRLHTGDAGDAELARLRECVGSLLYRI